METEAPPISHLAEDYTSGQSHRHSRTQQSLNTLVEQTRTLMKVQQSVREKSQYLISEKKEKREGGRKKDKGRVKERDAHVGQEVLVWLVTAPG